MKLPATTEFIQELRDEVIKQKLRPFISIIQHLLPDTLEFLRILSENDLSPDVFVPIPYSTREELLLHAEKYCKNLLQLPLQRLGFHTAEVLSKAIAEGRTVLAHEVGGYLAEPLRTRPPEFDTKRCKWLI